MRAKKLMVKDVFSIDPQDLTGKALEEMKAHHIQHLVVMDADQQVVGMLSDRDLRRMTNVTASVGSTDLEDLRVYNVPVQQIMTKNPISVSPDTSIKKVASLIYEGSFHCLLVRDKAGDLLGIVTDQDILRAVSEGKLK